MSRTVTPARRARRPALAFEPLSAFAGLQEAAAAGRAEIGITVSFLRSRCALAAEFLHTRTDRCKIVGSAGSGHVSSSSLAEPRRGSCCLLRKASTHARAWAGLGQAKITGADASRFGANVMCTFAAMSLNGIPANSEASIISIMCLEIAFRCPVKSPIGVIDIAEIESVLRVKKGADVAPAKAGAQGRPLRSCHPGFLLSQERRKSPVFRTGYHHLRGKRRSRATAEAAVLWLPALPQE